MRDRSPGRVGRDINSCIAGRVRSLRAAREMSLDALAAKSAVSRSMLSLVERGQSSPTAVVLEKIATGLGVPLAALFDDPGAVVNPISRHVERTSWRDPQSGYLRRNISPAHFASPLRIVEVVLPAGARVAYETAAREMQIHQQIWMQRGSIEVTLGSTTYILSKGDCLAIRLNELTTFHNGTRKAARYVVVVATEHLRARR